MPKGMPGAYKKKAMKKGMKAKAAGAKSKKDMVASQTPMDALSMSPKMMPKDYKDSG